MEQTAKGGITGSNGASLVLGKRKGGGNFKERTFVREKEQGTGSQEDRGGAESPGTLLPE